MYRAKWANIPPELRERAQWCYTDPNASDGHKKAPRKRGGYKADKTNPAHWMTFEEASFTAHEVGGEVGFCLSKEDPFTCIDLDVKNADSHPDKPWLWTNQDDLNRHHKIVQVFNSFTEKSTSGRGLHVWLYGAIPMGAHHGPTEVYGSEAFIICTGDVYLNRMIEDGGENLGILYSEIRKQQDATLGQDEVAEHEEYLSDFEVFEMGMAAANAEKFNFLCNLHADKVKGFTEYESNSEADLALLSIFAFYTKSNVQVKRLFRYCPLSEREKSQVNDVYLNRTLKGIRRRAADKAARMVYVDAAIENIRSERIREAREAEDLARQAPIHVPVIDYDPQPETDTPDPLTQVSIDDSIAASSDLTYPPGNVGAMARWIVASAKRPLVEVGVASALGFFAGVAGRGWNVSGQGLNLYIVLIGKSGIGKEWLHGSISAINKMAGNGLAFSNSFFETSEARSAQALSKLVVQRKCFLHLHNEWGRRLEHMSDPRNSSAQEIRTLMTSLFHKSGEDSEMGGMTYSDKEKNTSGGGAVAYSMIGESTPGTFYQAISGSMMEDGTMSRYLHIETDADRIPLNDRPRPEFPAALLTYIIDLMNVAANMNSFNTAKHIKRTDGAAKAFGDFELFADSKMLENPDDETKRQLFNRAGIKAMRIAAVLAVADNHHDPIITAEQANWAISLVMRDITRIEQLIEQGDLGLNEGNRLKKMRMAFKYAIRTIEAQGAMTQKMIRDGNVPLGVLRSICMQSSAYRDRPNASTSTLVDRALSALVDSGDVLEVPKTKLVTDYGYTGRAYTYIG